jgi:hypothetical protein
MAAFTFRIPTATSHRGVALTGHTYRSGDSGSKPVYISPFRRHTRRSLTTVCFDAPDKWGIRRGLAGRAPYFYNGAAASLDDVVEFYNQRFNLSMTEQQKSDLVAFLRTL